MKLKKLINDYLLTLAAAVLIIVFAILREQSFLKTLPTLVTLVVQLLLVRANRYAFLLGGTNALIYGAAYLSEGLYFSCISAVLMSAPLQYYSFVVWSRRREKPVGGLRFLSPGKLLATVGATVAIWLVCYFALGGLFQDATSPLLDSYLFAAGLTSSLLAAWQYVETQYISILSSILSLGLWIALTLRNPANVNYVIIAAYNLYRITQAAVAWTRRYLQAKKEKENAAELPVDDTPEKA